ncbi:MAG: hypothetical protein DRP85_07295, partial [Candidatus Makaraimicrobium thalassicum]
MFSDAGMLASVLSIGGYLLGDPEKNTKPLPLEHLESVMKNELGSALTGIDASKVVDKDGVVLIPYTKADKKYIIQIALKNTLSAQDLAGYEWVISDKYAVKILPEDYKEPEPAPDKATVKKEEPQVAVSEPIAELTADEIQVPEEADNLKKPSKFSVRAVVRSIKEVKPHAFKAISGFSAGLFTGGISLASMLGSAGLYLARGDFTGITAVTVLAGLIGLAGLYLGWAAARYFRVGRATSKAVERYYTENPDLENYPATNGIPTPKQLRRIAIARSDGYRHPAFGGLSPKDQKLIELHESFKSHFWGMVVMAPVISGFLLSREKRSRAFGARQGSPYKMGMSPSRSLVFLLALLILLLTPLSYTRGQVTSPEFQTTGQQTSKAQEVEGLIEELKDKDWNIRESAAVTLGDIGNKRAVGPLIQALKDKDWYVRSDSAAEALGKIGDKRAVEPLIEVLKKNENGYVRRSAAWALGEIGDKGAVEPLVQALKDEDSDVRKSVARALGKIGDKGAVEPLIELEKSGIVEAVFEELAIWRALDKLGVKGASAKCDFYEKIEKLIDSSRCGDRDTCVWANEMLGTMIKDKIVVNALITNVLYANDWERPGSAARALTKSDDPRVFAVLIRALGYPSGGLNRRLTVLDILGEMGDARAVGPITKVLLNDGVDIYRREAAVALGNIGDKRAVEALIEALKDENDEVRRYAARALGKISDERAAEPLVQALKDEDLRVRESAAEALRKIGWIPGNETEKAEYYVGLKRWHQVSKIGNAAIPALIRELKDPSSARFARRILVKIGKPAMSFLISELKNEDKHVRKDAAEALGDIGDKRAVEPLIQALKDEDPNVRESAAEALRKIGWIPRNETEKAEYYVGLSRW